MYNSVQSDKHIFAQCIVQSDKHILAQCIVQSDKHIFAQCIVQSDKHIVKIIQPAARPPFTSYNSSSHNAYI